MRLSDLLGLEVRTESGERLGRVFDVRGRLTGRRLDITGLVVGRVGVLERIGIGAPRSTLRVHADDIVAWTDVRRADRRGVVVADGARPGRA